MMNDLSHLTFDVPNPFVHPVAVADADIDGQGHVNNAIYVHWMDDASTAHSDFLGYTAAEYRKMGGFFVVRRHEIDYLAPVLKGEEIVIATWPQGMEKCTAWRRHQMVRARDNKTVTRALSKWIYVDIKTGRPKRIPEPIIQAFHKANPHRLETK